MNDDDEAVPDHQIERKYLIDAATAAAIAHRLAAVCAPDPRCAAHPAGRSMHSLYFDTPTRALLATSQVKPNLRQRARVRWSGGGKVLCEVKVKRGDTVLRKRRGRLPAARWPGILGEPRAMAPRRLLKSGAFLDLYDRLALEPALHVCFRREAWMQLGADLRIVFDRDLCCFPADGDARIDHDPAALATRRIAMDDAWTLVADGVASPVLMEFAAAGGVPAWFEELVADFALVPCGASKYALAALAAAPLIDLRASRFAAPVLEVPSSRLRQWTTRVFRRIAG